MKATVLIILTTFYAAICFGQTDTVFDIKETFVKNIFSRKTANSFTKQNKYFFEDENYICFKSCHGEFGGTIIFKNKKSGIEFICDATCPVIVNKFKGNYIVTTTLRHMSGYSEIFEIENPDSLKQFQDNNIPKTYRPKTNSGKKILLHASGVLTLASFVFKDQLYHIITDYEKTFVAKIENGNFVNVEFISNINIRTKDTEVILTNDNHIIVFFNNKVAKGYIDIFQNKINLTRYR